MVDIWFQIIVPRDYIIKYPKDYGMVQSLKNSIEIVEELDGNRKGMVSFGSR